jgi:hypothetical protein
LFGNGVGASGARGARSDAGAVDELNRAAGASTVPVGAPDAVEPWVVLAERAADE